MKVFLTGSSGILGTDIVKQLEKENCEILTFNSKNIVLSDFRDVSYKVKDFNPDVVIHSAAMTNVDLCEDDRDAAILTNIIGSQNMARAAAQVNAKIIYISSCGVYGNDKSNPYCELDPTAPVNFHHYTKLEGEKRVKEHNNNFLIVRPGWLFGGTLEHRKNFVEARRKEAASATKIRSAFDKIGSPTYTADLAKQLMVLINKDLGGTFNIINEECASRFDYVAEIVKLFDFKITVEPVNSNEFPRKAIMPDNECLLNMNLNLLNLNLMRSWKEALKEYITINYNL